MTKAFLLAAAAVLAIGIPAAISAQGGRTPPATIVVIDMSRVTQQCTACVAANTAMQGMVTQGQQRAQQIAAPAEAEMRAIQQQAQANAAMPAGPAKMAAETALRTRAQALDSRRQAFEQEIQRIEQNIKSVRDNVSRQVFDRLNPTISQVMAAHGANLAVDVDETLAHAASIDVTNEVMSALNSVLPSVSVTPMPQAPTAQPPQSR